MFSNCLNLNENISYNSFELIENKIVNQIETVPLSEKLSANENSYYMKKN